MSDEERDNPEVQMDGDDEEDGVGEVLGELELSKLTFVKL